VQKKILQPLHFDDNKYIPKLLN